MVSSAPEQNPGPVFTPARRPEFGPLNTYTPNDPSEPAWTASRCHRLLRPLTSRIAALRKRAPVTSNGRASTDSDGASVKEKNLTERTADVSTSSKLQYRRLSKKLDNDPDWAPNDQPAKRVRHTYKSKNGIASRRALQLPSDHSQIRSSGAIDPLSVLHENASESCNSDEIDPTKRPRKRQRISDDKFRNVARSTSASDWTIYLQLYKALECLLKFTKRRNQPTRGADSLFNLCLKAVPNYITEEQAIILDTDPDSQEQASDSVYADLESWGSTNGTSWKPFRILVRSHAIAILFEAIADGTLPHRVAIELADLCFCNDAVEEGYRLCDSILLHMNPICGIFQDADHSTVAQKGAELTAVRNLVSLRSLWGYFFAKLNDLLRRNVMPVEWMSRKDMSDIWNRVILSITKADGDSHFATMLLQTTIELACGISLKGSSLSNNLSLHRIYPREDFKQSRILRADTALTHTILNILAILLSINALSSDDDHCRTVHDTVAALALRVLVSQQTATLSSLEGTLQVKLRSSLILFVFILLPALNSRKVKSHSLGPELVLKAWSAASHGQDLAQYILRLIRTIALCCGKVNIDASLECVQKLVSHVHGICDDLPSVAPKGTVKVLQNKLREAVAGAAVEFAETTEIPAHLNWAYELEHQEENAQNHSLRTCRCIGRGCDVCATATSGFRWEEGIEEWVQKTPSIKTDRPSRRARIVLSSPVIYQEPSSPVGSDGYLGTLAALTDTPLPPSEPERRYLDRKLLSGIPKAPAAISQAPAKVREMPIENPVADKIGHLFDLSMNGSHGSDDIDELSILTDRSNNQGGIHAITKHAIDEDDSDDLTERKHMAKYEAEERSRNLILESSPIITRSPAKKIDRCSFGAPIEVRLGQKRKFGGREKRYDGYSSSEDELAF